MCIFSPSLHDTKWADMEANNRIFGCYIQLISSERKFFIISHLFVVNKLLTLDPWAPDDLAMQIFFMHTTYLLSGIGNIIYLCIHYILMINWLLLFSTDRYDKPNYSQASEGERDLAPYPRNFTAVERGEIPVSNIANENTRSKLIPLEGCSSSEAVQFLAERK